MQYCSVCLFLSFFLCYAANALSQAVHGRSIMPGHRNVSGMLGKRLLSD